VIPNSACGIPSTAAGYSMNVAVVPRGTLGYLTLWPSGESQPLVATLNSIDGRVKSNAAIVPAGSNGAVSVFATDTTDVILDINGYFEAGSSPAALAFYPLTPCRIADTRNPTSPLGGPSLAAQSVRSFPIQASSCGLPANAQAYSLNFAAVPQGASLGYITAWPAGQSQPLVASLNDPTGTVLSNAVVVPAGTGGAVDVFTTDATDLVIDINGYFAPQGPGGLSLFTVTPCRVLDTRLPAGSPPFSTTYDVNVTASPCGVPATAQAFVFNATVVPPGFLGYITMWPQGQSQPLAATLNSYDGAVTNNMAIVPTTTGSISVFPSNPTHLVLDIFGYFATLNSGQGNETCFLGDSITADSGATYYNPSPYYLGTGWVDQLPVLSSQSVYSADPTENFGVPGNTTTQMLARVSDVYTKPCKHVFVLGGTNDVGTLTPAQTATNLSAIYSALKAHGKDPIACTIPPKNAAVAAAQQTNVAIRSVASQYSLPLVDFYSALATAVPFDLPSFSILSGASLPPHDTPALPGPQASGRHSWVLVQNHQLVFDRVRYCPLVGRFCPLLHHAQPVEFPLAFIHDDSLL
jgi:lysophospholipase L1-like esterase